MDKDTILQQVTQVDIYNFYYGSDFTPYVKISSPFSEDKNPSFKVFKNGTFKCFSTGKQGDVWQFVADIKNLDCKTQFAEILNIISQDMGVIREHSQKQKNIKSVPISADANHFVFTSKAFTKQHFDYWLQGNWNVTEDILKRYNVKALDKFEFFNSKKNEIQKIKLFTGILGFIYQIDDNAELYIPKQDKAKKFFYNNLQFSDIFGYEQLPENAPYIIITAGKKDCLILNANGFPAVSFRSESGFIKEDEMLKLRQKSNNIYICYDNDKTGLKIATEICQHYSIRQIILPDKYNDIADYFKVYDKSHFTKLLAEVQELENDLSEEDTPNTIFHIAEKYLSTYYKFRYNTIALDIEYCKKTTHDWQSLNENSLYLEMQKKGIKISINNLIAILKSEFVPHYNPIQEYFENLPKWDGKTDYIGNLANYVHPLDREKFNHHFKKWCVRTVKCALIDRYFNKQAFVLVHMVFLCGSLLFRSVA